MLNGLITHICQLDLRIDLHTQNEFTGTIFMEGVDLDPKQIGTKWVSREMEEEREDLQKSIQDECYHQAEEEAMVATKISAADALAAAELNAVNGVKEAAEVMEIDDCEEERNIDTDEDDNQEE